MTCENRTTPKALREHSRPAASRPGRGRRQPTKSGHSRAPVARKAGDALSGPYGEDAALVCSPGEAGLTCRSVRGCALSSDRPLTALPPLGSKAPATNSAGRKPDRRPRLLQGRDHHARTRGLRCHQPPLPNGRWPRSYSEKPLTMGIKGKFNRAGVILLI